MSYSVKNLALLALASGFATVGNAQATSGSGSTTRYWDCCKGSCSWPGKADVSNPVTLCGKDDEPLDDYNTKSASDGGNGYMCSNQQPWAVSDDLAYGFAAVHIPGGGESDWCCACYELTFTSTDIAGKKMIVQATNTGADLAGGQFDLAIPGGGVGIYNACTNQWGAPSSGWGAQYGGISTDTCPNLPQALQPGCEWRFGDWFANADNPDVDWKKVTCPKALTDKTGCVRAGETPTDDGAAASSPAAKTKAASSADPTSTKETTSAPAYTAPASSSTESSVTTSSEEAPAYTAPESSATTGSEESDTSSAEAAPVESSNSPPAYSAPASSEAVPTQSSEYAPSAPTGATISQAAPSASTPEDGEGACEIQYVYED